MATDSVSAPRAVKADRVPPYSEGAEKGVLGSILLDADRVMDLCLTSQLVPESFHVPAHRRVYAALVEMAARGAAIDQLTLADRLRDLGDIDKVGGQVAVDRLIDATPTPAHAEYYIDLVRQRHLLRCIIDSARRAEAACYDTAESADLVLSRVEQDFLDITERQHGTMTPWPSAVKQTMEYIERVLDTHSGLSGISTGFHNLDRLLLGLRPGEMIVLAARPSMGKTSLAMNIVENVALGKLDAESEGRPVGVFSLEMPKEALVMRMLCSRAEVQSNKLVSGYVSTQDGAHGKLIMAASVLSKAPIFLDDTGGLDVLELRARARRMRKKHAVELIVIDYLQLLHSKEEARQGRQIETASISGHLKAMAKELKVPVLVLSQLSRAPEQRDKTGRPKLSDLRDSGAIEQDADVVCLLRRPCKYPDDDQYEDTTLAIVEVAKQRNGPTGDLDLNFEESFTRFRDRRKGVDAYDGGSDEAGPGEERLPAGDT